MRTIPQSVLLLFGLVVGFALEALVQSFYRQDFWYAMVAAGAMAAVSGTGLLVLYRRERKRIHALATQ
jgi:hypothetical protein